MIMPCGFGDSGGLAVLTTPGRDTVGGTILCEADLLGMEGSIFSLPRSNLILLGKSNGVGALVLRGVLRMPEGQDTQPIEEFEEVDAKGLSHNPENKGDVMDVDSAPSLHNVEDIVGKTTLYVVSEFGPDNPFSIFFVKSPQGDGIPPYSIIIMRSDVGNDNKDEIDGGVGLSVVHVHHLTANPVLDENEPRTLSSVSPTVSELSANGMVSSISFGCVWSCGHASLFNVVATNKGSTEETDFKISESVFVGDSSKNTGKVEDNTFFKSSRIVAMDLVSLPNHIFTCDDTNNMPSFSLVAPDAISFPPDRLSMHGSWIAKEGGSPNDQHANTYSNKTFIAICRRSGSLEVYSKDDALNFSQIENPSENNTNVLPVWKAEGCSHGVSVLGQPESGSNNRKPEGHDVETAEVRFFVSGPSLNEDLCDSATGKDAWMLRSLCILVDTSLGDLQLYSGSKRTTNANRLEFARVPLSCVSRPSDEAGRHFVKLRRKGIVSDVTQKGDFRANRLHRFHGISLQDGLFAATSRPLWFVSERGAPAIVSHKSRHVSPAGARPVPVSGFCSAMPTVFQVSLSNVSSIFAFNHTNTH
jgi:hypothetical protein